MCFRAFFFVLCGFWFCVEWLLTLHFGIRAFALLFFDFVSSGKIFCVYKIILIFAAHLERCSSG